mmetsp:Transcript_743/g.1479  ORF Transcript_743/g.1479 Transcript_743/m.1479 type:complete len:100 (+) Transcript_743:1057-1356(+)
MPSPQSKEIHGQYNFMVQSSVILKVFSSLVDASRNIFRDAAVHERVFVLSQLPGSVFIGAVNSSIKGTDGNWEVSISLTRKIKAHFRNWNNANRLGLAQ